MSWCRGGTPRSLKPRTRGGRGKGGRCSMTEAHPSECSPPGFRPKSPEAGCGVVWSKAPRPVKVNDLHLLYKVRNLVDMLSELSPPSLNCLVEPAGGKKRADKPLVINPPRKTISCLQRFNLFSKRSGQFPVVRDLSMRLGEDWLGCCRA
jgi:hypothetical protein